jgi:hypothetical protein
VAAHYIAVLGQDLYRILYADGWRPLTHRGNIIVLWKNSQRPKQLTLNTEISLKRVRALCTSAKITANRFDDLYRTAPEPPQQAVQAAVVNAATPKIH